MNRREWLRACLPAMSGIAAFPLIGTGSPQTDRKRVLYFTRSVGFEHSVVHRDGDRLSHSERILTELGERGGFDVECAKDGRVFDGRIDQYDAFAFYTCGDLAQDRCWAGPSLRRC